MIEDFSVVADRVLRHDVDAPGYAHVRYHGMESLGFRRWMLEVSQQFSDAYLERYGEPLGIAWATRFDMRSPGGGPHKDAGYAESLLFLGYEPTTTVSTVTVSNYRDGPFTRVPIDTSAYDLLALNNSVGEAGDERPIVGVYHHGVVDQDQARSRRVVNSICLAPGVESVDLADFLSDLVF